MKKRWISIALVCTTALALAACGANAGKEEASGAGTESQAVEGADTGETGFAAEEKTYPDEAYIMFINPSDYVTVGDYSNLSVEVTRKREVTDEDVENSVQQIMANNQIETEITDRTDVREGDIVDIDYVGKVDGQEYDNGSDQGLHLEVGSDVMGIEGFDDGLIGHKKGETVTLNLTFPEDYGTSDLAGQPVVFEVTINGIYTYTEPELTDEYIASLQLTDDRGKLLKTADDFRAYTREQLEMEADTQFKQEFQQKAIEQLRTIAEYKGDLPEAYRGRIYDYYHDEIQQEADVSGMTIEEVCEAYNIDLDNIADTYTKDMLLLAAIANQEGVSVDEAGARKYLEEQYTANADYFSMMGMTSSEDYASMVDIRAAQESLLLNSVLDLLQEKIKIVEVEPTEEDLEALPDEDFEMGTEDLNEYEEETEEGPNPEDLEPLEDIEDGEASD